VPGKTAPSDLPSANAYDGPQHVGALLKRLEELDQALGDAVPKKRMNGGIVGIEVRAARLLEAGQALRDQLGFEMLTCVSGVDMIDHLESIYHFRSISQNWVLQVRVRVPNENLEVDSLVSVYPSANWLERETYDMYGIVYRGHPDLRRILLDDEFHGYPLLKSFHQTPITVHDRATTQSNAIRAVAGEQQRFGREVTAKHLGQGTQERLHPGKLTFGSAAVYLETGQGVESGANPDHGYVVDKDTEAGPEKPQRG
jgi:NADH/F420H2 dehydrogenase subunit C